MGSAPSSLCAHRHKRSSSGRRMNIQSFVIKPHLSRRFTTACYSFSSVICVCVMWEGNCLTGQIFRLVAYIYYKTHNMTDDDMAARPTTKKKDIKNKTLLLLVRSFPFFLLSFTHVMWRLFNHPSYFLPFCCFINKMRLLIFSSE